MEFLLLPVCLLLTWWLVCGAVGGAVASSLRGRPVAGFWWGAVLGIFAIIPILLMRDMRRRCVYCRSVLPDSGVVRRCPSCRTDLGNRFAGDGPARALAVRGELDEAARPKQRDASSSPSPPTDPLADDVLEWLGKPPKKK